MATTVSWLATARLATAFAAAGCQVDVVCPPGHPVTQARNAARIHRYRALAPLQSLEAAIGEAAPDLVVPCDDLATAHLHRLYRRPASATAASGAVRPLVERSLGDPSSFPVASSRTPFIKLAHRLGIRVPPTAVAGSREELREWLQRYGGPAVLKTDESYGGRGVRIVRTEDEALREWEALSSPPSPIRAIKRALVNGDRNYLLPCLSRTRPIVNVQSFVAGQNANAAAACWQGTVLASIVVRIQHTLDFLGPASRVELIDAPDITTAIARVAGELRLSGLVGFDFILEEGTRDAYLIEMNPRATQTCHLSLGGGRDLPAALRAVLSGEPLREAPPVTASALIALFPQEWFRDPASPFLQVAYHDVPWDQPDLIKASVTETIIHKAWSWIFRARVPGTLTEYAPPLEDAGSSHRSRQLGETV